MVHVNLKFYFHPNETELPCNVLEMKTKGAFKKEPEVYALGPYNCKKNDKTYDTTRYSIMYRTNPGVKLGDIGPEAGFHQGDIEFILILRDKSSKLPVWVYYSAHGSNEGIWRKFADCPTSKKVLENNTVEYTLNVYVALGSHANYPTPGIKPRVLYCANDQCSAVGRQWLVKTFVPASSVYNSYTVGSNLMTKEIHPKEKTWNATQRITEPVIQTIDRKISSIFS